MGFSIKEIRTAYENAYKKMQGKTYVKAKIYHGGKSFDLSKRWYVYYGFIDEESGKIKRQTPLTFKVNQRFKTVEERMYHLTLIKNIVNEYLEKGWSPHQISNLDKHTAESCLDYALLIKKKEVKQTTFRDYESRINRFKLFLKKQGVLYDEIEKINKRHVSEFLNGFEGAKNRNNAKVALSAVFKVLSDESYIDFNFVSEIRNQKVLQKPIKIYSDKKVGYILNILERSDKDLLMFIYFEGYMFWRPLEIVRIKDTDIDWDKGVISVETKAQFSKTKIIPKLILDRVKTYVVGKKGFIFEPKNADWNDTKETNRRDYYTRKFAKFRKINGIDSSFKLYHFRHTFITKIYLELRKELSKEDSIKELSLITGHDSKAIYSYIQVNDVELPKDYSEMLRFD